MAGIPNRYAQKKRKFIMIFLIIFLIVMLFIVIKNFTKPKEAPKQKATKPPVELSQAPVREQTQVKEISNDDLNDEPVFSDFVSELFAQFDSRLVSKVTANNRFFGYVNFYDNQTGTLHQSISFEDFEMLGYLVEDSASGVWVSKGDHVFVVTSKPDPEQLNFNQTISNQNQPF
jgi:regulatory protein YycI of two-component signal transduction system YycFG